MVGIWIMWLDKCIELWSYVFGVFPQNWKGNFEVEAIKGSYVGWLVHILLICCKLFIWTNWFKTRLFYFIFLLSFSGLPLITLLKEKVQDTRNWLVTKVCMLQTHMGESLCGNISRKNRKFFHVNANMIFGTESFSKFFSYHPRFRRFWCPRRRVPTYDFFSRKCVIFFFSLHDM